MAKEAQNIQSMINFAKLAEQAERYEDMVKFSKEFVETIIKSQSESRKKFKDQEIKLFASAYKCKINSRRTAWRALQILQSKETNNKTKSAYFINRYKQNIEKEIREIGKEVLSMIKEIMSSGKSTAQIDVQMFKMKGDFHRYLCQIVKDPQELKKMQKQCQSAYKKGIQILKSQKDAITSFDSRRLVFYYEITVSLPKAIQICEQGFNSALEDISDLEQAKYIDSVTIMQLMHDNITAWKLQKEKNAK